MTNHESIVGFMFYIDLHYQCNKTLKVDIVCYQLNIAVSDDSNDNLLYRLAMCFPLNLCYTCVWLTRGAWGGVN